ncbi:MAG: hypothetical protein KIT87_00920 [Anaerolineae bacterium]|nr:hypothetical protein [Anaerolineae bacterium]
MDWFRRQRRAKTVSPAQDEMPALPPPSESTPLPESEAPTEAEADPMAEALPFGVPQPFQVEIANLPPAPASVLIPQPLDVRLTTPPPPEVKPDAATHAFLLAEFGYITQTAFQSTEDRARVANFYFVTAAAVVGAVLGFKLDTSPTPWFFWAFSLIFAVLIALGWLTILQLAQLRAAWLESVRAMNQLKTYYMDRCDEKARAAFRWTDATRPPALKPRSVAFLMFVSVVVINFALTLGLSGFLTLALNPASLTAGGLTPGVVIGAVVGLALAYAQYWTYRRFLAWD